MSIGLLVLFRSMDHGTQINTVCLVVCANHGCSVLGSDPWFRVVENGVNVRNSALCFVRYSVNLLC
jgi:hypothetical protein